MLILQIKIKNNYKIIYKLLIIKKIKVLLNNKIK